MAKSSNPRPLGRGLSALMADVEAPRGSAQPASSNDRSVPVERLQPNPNQPRRTFSKAALQELAASISEKGIIQPLIVRPAPEGADGFEIVAGERRWRAAQLAQLHEVPVLIRDFSDDEVLEVAIIENIQRADLNPIDEADGYRQLMERFGRTQEQMATALGKSRSYIANALRLLTLPEDVQGMLITGALTVGHARTLVGLSDASHLARQMVDDKLTVRDAERLTRKSKTGRAGPRAAAKDADTRAIENELSAHLHMAVTLTPASDGQSGTLSLRYRNLQQLDDLLRALSGD